MLTDDQKKSYKEDGFIVVPQVISSESLKAMRDEVEKWIEES